MRNCLSGRRSAGTGRAGDPGSYDDQSVLARKFVIDFEGGALASLPPNTPVRALFSVGDSAEVIENVLQPNPVTKGYRVTLRIKVKDPSKVVEMREALVANDRVLSETWSYQIPPGTANQPTPAQAVK